jgi:SpoIID/LytB domain protein
VITFFRARRRPLAAGTRACAAVIALVALVGAATVLPAQEARANDASLTFLGHGWGHGRGMGQYGALGYAIDHGWGYGQILSHYYGGTHLAGDAGNPTIGVEITRLGNVDSIDTIVTGPALSLNGVAAPAQALLIQRDAANPAGFQVLAGPGCAGPWTLWTAGQGSGLTVRTSADPGVTSNLLHLCEVGRTTSYRGAIRVVNASGGNGKATVNDVTSEDYLRSVVPSESSASWANLGNGIEALKAQAVAARSYALASAPRPSGALTCDTTACQVYAGASIQLQSGTVTSVEQASTDQAVAQTSGQVMRFDSNGYVARTEFSSSTGGYTAGGTFPAVIDDGDSTSRNPNSTWAVTVSQSAVSAALGTGTIASIAVTARNGLGAEGGRVQTLVVVNTSGQTFSFTGGQVRSALGLKSDWFSVSGVTQVQATALVRALYQDILGREPDPTGQATWTSIVMATGDTRPVALGIVMSNERLYNFVQRQYRTALGREPDPTGTQTWVNLLVQGMTVPELQVQVYASEEGFDVLGHKDLGTWVDGVYRGMLGRSAEPSERAAWAAVAMSSGRQVVARGIAMSNEAALVRLNEYYQLMLGRSPDPAGIANYGPMMAGNGDFILPVEIGRSAEYFNRAQTR